MKKIQQMILVLMITFSIFPISKVSAETESTAIQKVLESSHEKLPEGFKIEKYLGDNWNRFDYVPYGESKEIPFVIEVENKSEEDVQRIFIQEDLSQLLELITDESLGNELSIGGYYMKNTLKSDGSTPLNYSETVQDLVDGIYVDLDRNSSITLKFKLELQSGLNDLTMIENTVLVNNTKVSVEAPVKQPEVNVYKQSIAYIGDTPYEEMPEGSDGDAEDGGIEEPIEDENMNFSYGRASVYQDESNEENFTVLEKAKAGSKIRYAIVLDNVGETGALDYEIKDISLDDIVPQYAQYVNDVVSVYDEYGISESFSLRENPQMEGLSKSKEITIQELKDGVSFGLWEDTRVILVFDIELNEELPRELEFIENLVEHLGGQESERTPVETPEDPNNPVVKEPDNPVVEEPDNPVVEEPDNPVVEEPDNPVVEEPDNPVVEDPNNPVVEDPDNPVVEEANNPVEKDPNKPVSEDIKETVKEGSVNSKLDNEKKPSDGVYEEHVGRIGGNLPATGVGTIRNLSFRMIFLGLMLFVLDKYTKD